MRRSLSNVEVIECLRSQEGDITPQRITDRVQLYYQLNPRLRAFHFSATPPIYPFSMISENLMRALPILNLTTLSFEGTLHPETLQALSEAFAATTLKITDLTLPLPPFKNLPIYSGSSLHIFNSPGIATPSVKTLTFSLRDTLSAAYVTKLSTDFPISQTLRW